MTEYEIKLRDELAKIALPIILKSMIDHNVDHADIRKHSGSFAFSIADAAMEARSESQLV